MFIFRKSLPLLFVLLISCDSSQKVEPIITTHNSDQITLKLIKDLDFIENAIELVERDILRDPIDIPPIVVEEGLSTEYEIYIDKLDNIKTAFDELRKKNQKLIANNQTIIEQILKINIKYENLRKISDKTIAQQKQEIKEYKKREKEREEQEKEKEGWQTSVDSIEKQGDL